MGGCCHHEPLLRTLDLPSLSSVGGTFEVSTMKNLRHLNAYVKNATAPCDSRVSTTSAPRQHHVSTTPRPVTAVADVRRGAATNSWCS